MNEPIEACGLILAGGQGSRAEGQDKGLLLWQDKPLVAHVVAAIEGHVSSIYISCNRHLDQYQKVSPHCFGDSDAYPQVQGPLAGIITARSLVPASPLLIAPCDTPRLDSRYSQRMLEGASVDSIRVAWDGHRRHYLHCLLSPQALESLPDYLAEGGRSVRGWLDSLNPELVDFSDQPDMFLNVNTLATLASLE